ncbi:unnamed protein product, partial [Ixodes persulcatus]
TPLEDNPGKCTVESCVTTAGALSVYMNQHIDPCQDFYGFVCGNFKEAQRRTRDQIMARIFENVQKALEKMTIPDNRLTAVQKAASLYQACIGVRCNPKDEIGALRHFMDKMDLSLVDIGRGSPLEKILRLSLQYNIFSLLEVTIDHTAGPQGEKTIKIGISTAHLMWITSRKRLSSDYKERLYMEHMKAYGLSAEKRETMDVIKQIILGENEAVGFLSDDKLREMESFAQTPITAFDFITPHFCAAVWCALLQKYASGIYQEDKPVFTSPGAVNYFDNLCEIAECLRLQLLIAWEVLRLLAPLASPSVAALYNETTGREICLSATAKVMEVPVLAVYLYKAVPQASLKAAKDMVEDIRNYALRVVRDAKWLSEGSRFSAISKLRSMGVEVGYPCSLCSMETMDTRYKAYPYAECNFLSDWLNASHMTTKWLLEDHGCVNYPITAEVTYISSKNMIIIPASNLLPPIFSLDATNSTNFGGLGHLIATEMMHAFDVDGSLKSSTTEDHFWWTPLRRCKYEKTVACFKTGHEKAAENHGHRLHGTIVNVMADVIGLALALRPYEDLADKKRVKGLPFEPKQLFFIASCAKWCSRAPFQGYAGNTPPSSRCNVMLMNMLEFATAFRCPQNSRMNLSKRCDF